MLVKSLMRKKVFTINPEEILREALISMVDNRVGCLVVLKNNKLVGIITERDVLSACAKKRQMDVDVLKVKDIMTNYVITVKPDQTIEKAVEIMMENKIKKLPVIKNEKLVGIITASDIASSRPQLLKEIADLLSVKV